MDPYNQNDYMTYIVKRNEDTSFNPKLNADGVELVTCAASIYHESNVCRRLEVLLRRVIENSNEVNAEFLNEIGFSKADADYIQVNSDGIIDINPASNWEDNQQ